jgi:haloalkane dehalogenase
MWSILWRDLLVELTGKGYRCVSFDAPGSGLTDGPGKVGIRPAADAVDDVVQQLGLDEFTMVVHDLGGPAALEAAGRWPERVEGMVAINAFAWRPSGISFRPMLAVMGSSVMREIDTWTGWLPRMGSTRFGLGRQWSRSTRKVFRQAMRHRGRRSFHRYVASVRKHDFAIIDSTMDRLDALPVLTVFGERNDPLRFQPKWAERFDDITQVVVPKGLHFPMCDDPELVASTITDWHQARVVDSTSLLHPSM